MMGGGEIFDAVMKSVREVSIGDEEYRKGIGSVISSLRNNRGLRRTECGDWESPRRPL